jgi:hypothetical protein
MTKCGKTSLREQVSSRRDKIEKWCYDKDLSDFIYVLIFHRGVLKYIKQAGNGNRIVADLRCLTHFLFRILSLGKPSTSHLA